MHELIVELQRYHSMKAHHLAKLETCISNLTEDTWHDEVRLILVDLFEPFQTSAEEEHHFNEELILQELRKTSAPIHRRVEEISGDHGAFNRISAQISGTLNDKSSGYVEISSTINRFVNIYKDHAAGEESIFFPTANQYLKESHWRCIAAEWK